MITDETLKKIKSFFKGETASDEKTLAALSKDASLFKVMPSLAVYPIDCEDLEKLVSFADKENSEGRRLTLTARSAGTDMSGGPLTEGVVVDFLKHFNRIKEIGNGYAVVEPGVYYRDFDKATIQKTGEILPSYPASRELCTVGGMTANNSGGEKTLTYGKTENYIRRLKMVLSDGSLAEFKPLDGPALAEKKKLQNFEGEIYRKMSALIDGNYDAIQKAKPPVTKNSAGYFLWNVYDKEKAVFDLSKLIVGSQGTLGLITEIEFALVKPKKYSHLLVVFLTDLDQLGATAAKIMEQKPESFESYDDQTLKVALKFLLQLMKQMGGNLITIGLEFIPEMVAVLEGGMPKLVLMAEFTSDDDSEALQMAETARQSLKSFHEKTRVTKTVNDENKYWIIRRESFNMLRKHVHGLRTAPFIDDFVVSPKSLPEFLPKLYKILEPYKKELIYTIAGHVGDGNFHIIPLVDMKKERTREIIKELSVKVYTLVLEYHGTITGEHNDGIIRTPFLKMQYGEKIIALFEETKKIWDPRNIFNPGKKVGAEKDYGMAHLDDK